jgi:hypothetical protein
MTFYRPAGAAVTLRPRMAGIDLFVLGIFRAAVVAGLIGAVAGALAATPGRLPPRSGS